MLRSFVIDYLLLVLITKNSTGHIAVLSCSGIAHRELYNISGMKWVDYVVLDKRFDIPIAFCRNWIGTNDWKRLVTRIPVKRFP